MGQEINKATDAAFGQCKIVVKDENQYYIKDGEGINCDVVFPTFEECPELPNLADGVEYGVYGLRAVGGYPGYVAEVRREIDDATKDFTAADFMSGEVQNWVAASADGGLTNEVDAAFSLRKLYDDWNSPVIELFREPYGDLFQYTPQQIEDGDPLEDGKFQSEPTPDYTNSTPSATFSLRDMYGNGNPVVQVRRKDGITRNLTEPEIQSGIAGDELLQNGDFASSTGWSLGAGWSVLSGNAVLDGTQGTTSYLFQSLPAMAGALTVVEIDIASCSDFSQCGMRLSSSTNRTFIQMDIDKIGKHKFIVNGSFNNSSEFRFFGFSGAQITISSVSAKTYITSELEDWTLENAAWSASTTMSRYDEDTAHVVAWFNQDSTWQESHPDPNIDDPSLWTIPAGTSNASITNNQITMSNDSYTQVNTVDVDYLVEGKIYLLEMDIQSQTTANKFAVRTQGDVIRPINITSGKFVQLIRCQASFNKQVWIQTNGATNGADDIVITSMSLKEVDHSFYQQTLIDQPALVPSGVLSTVLDKPAIYFNGNSFLRCITPNGITSQANYAMVAQSRDPGADRYALFGSDSITSISQSVFVEPSNVIAMYGGGDPSSASRVTAGWSYDEQNQFTADYYRTTSSTIQVDLNLEASAALDLIQGQQGGMRIGSDRRVVGSAFLDGFVQEFIICNTREAPKFRTYVKHSQMWYYDPSTAPDAIMKAVTWYDQSGNGNDLTAEDWHAPYLIEGSDYYYSNGLPSLFFTGIDGEFMTSALNPVLQNFYGYVCSVVEPQSFAPYQQRGTVFSSDDNSALSLNNGVYVGFDASNLQASGGGNLQSTAFAQTGDQVVLSAEFESSGLTAKVDASTVISSNINSSPNYSNANYFRVGARTTNNADPSDPGDNFRGMMQELVFGSEDLGQVTRLIESSMMQFYKSITPPTVGLNGYVSTLYDQGQRANHLSQPDPLKQPKVVDDGVIIAKSGKPVMLFNEDTQFDTAAFAGMASPIDSFWIFQPDATYESLALPSDAGAAGATNRGLTAAEGVVSDSLPLEFTNAQAAYSLRYLSATPSSQYVIRVRRSSDQSERDFTPSEISNGTLTSWVDGSQLIPPSDYDSGAAGAYSLRYISNNYNGPVIRVRRTDDDAEQNFTPDEITDGTLEEFVAGADIEIGDFTNTPSSAWSLRSLDPDYTGPVCELRREIDGSVRDFTAEEINDGTLIDWAEGKDFDISDAAGAYSLRSLDGSTSTNVVRLRRVNNSAEKDFAAGDLTGSVVGSQVILNPEFDNATGWATTGAWSIAGGQAVNSGTDGNLQQGSRVTVGNYYIATLEIVACSSFDDIRLRFGAASVYSLSSIGITTTGTHQIAFQAQSTFFLIQTINSATATIEFAGCEEYTPTAAEQWAIEGVGNTTQLFAFVTTLYDQAASNEQVFPDTGLTDTGNYNTSGNTSVSTAGAFTITATEYGAFNTNPFPDFAEIGKTYKVEFDYYTDNTANGFWCRGLGVPATGNDLPASTTPTTKSFVWTCTGTANLVAAQTNGTYNGTTITVTGIRVTEIGNPATQSTPTAQPKLITAGVTELDNGKPAMLFDGVDDELVSPYSGDATATFAIVANRGSGNNRFFFHGGSVTRNGIYRTFPNAGLTINNGGTAFQNPVGGNAGEQSLFFVLNDGSGNGEASENGGAVTSGTLGTTSMTELNIGGSISGINGTNGYYQEIIIYDSDQSTKRTLIEENINNYYSIYNSSFTARATVKTWYDQTGNGIHGEAQSEVFEPIIVLNGSIVTENGRPAILFKENATNKFFNINSNIGFSGDQSRSMFSVFRAYSTGGGGPGIIGRSELEGTGSDWAICPENSQIAIRVKCFLAGLPSCNGNSRYSTSGTTDHMMLTVILPDGGRAFDHQVWQNGTQLSRTGGTNRDINTGQTGWQIGRTEEQDNVGFDGVIQEIILFDSNQSANRSFIENNQAAYYGIQGSGSGAVTTWFDQSGNNRNFIQTDPAKQPTIVIQGDLVTENGKPAIDFNGTSQGMVIPNGGWSDTVGSYTFIMVSSQDGSGYAVSTWGPTSDLDFYIEGNIGSYQSDRQWRGFGGWRDGQQHIISITLNEGPPSQGGTFSDGETLETGLFYLPIPFPSGQAIGLMQNPGSNGNRVLGKFQELIVYSSYETENRAQIEANMNEHYQVYSAEPTGFGFVAAIYDQTGNGNHLTQLVANGQPTIVDDGNLLLQAGMPVVSFDGVDDELLSTTVSVTQPNSIFTVAASTLSNQDVRMWNIGSGSAGQLLFYRADNTRAFAGGTSIANATNLDNYLYSVIFDGANTEAYANGQQFDTVATVGANGGNELLLGRDSTASSHTSFNFQEMILYSGNKSDDRQDIDANILTYYPDLPTPTGGAVSLTSNYGSPSIVINGTDMPAGSDSSDARGLLSTSELNLVSHANADTSLWSDFVIGSTQGYEYKGLVAEFSLYNQSISSDKDCVEQSMKQYYGLDSI